MSKNFDTSPSALRRIIFDGLGLSQFGPELVEGVFSQVMCNLQERARKEKLLKLEDIKGIREKIAELSRLAYKIESNIRVEYDK